MDTDTAFSTKLVEPVCSICVANFNGTNFLETCLESICRQDFPYPIEIIVHDDASTDGSADIVSEKFPNVRLIRSDRNVGFCVSNNRMVAAARGRFILLLNNDAELYENSLSTLYNFAMSENIHGIIGLPQYEMRTGQLIDIGSFLDPFLNPVPNKDDACRNVAMVIGACMWLPRNLWEELGGFPEWFGSIAEDMYLCCLARLKGYPVIVLPKSGFNHWVGRSLGGGKVIQRTLQTTYRRRALSERNKSYVMLLCYPGFLAFILVPLHFLALTLEGLLLSAIKKERRVWGEIYRPCFLALWRHRNRLMQLRRKIQLGRQVNSISFCSVHTFLPHKLTMLIKYKLPTLR
jgi:GT2 family glycosyltransferase